MASDLIPAARPLKPPIGKILDVFLSATVKDLDDIRRDVCKALHEAQTPVYLQEDWTLPSGDVVQACLEKLESSSGYLGIFGFYYGWMPNGAEQSITEIECAWARQRWGAARPPPIFIFVPAADSRAEQELKAMADLALLRQSSDDPHSRDDSLRRQAEFVRSVCNQGNIVGFFEDIDKLKRRAIIAILLWNQKLLEKALQRAGSANFLIPQHEFGRIGRRQQLSALEDMLMARDERHDAPGLCAVVHGPSNCGLVAFSACLSGWEGLDAGKDIEPGRPPREPYTVDSLTKWALSNLGARPGTEATIEGLAATIARQLEHNPEVLLVQDIDSLDGKFPAFSEFWSALQTALVRHWRKGAYRFTMIAFTSEAPANDNPAVWREAHDGANVDYSRILVLPSLGPLTLTDLEVWLESHRVPQFSRIARRAIGFGIPVEVYDRLNAAGFWKQIAERRK